MKDMEKVVKKAAEWTSLLALGSLTYLTFLGIVTIARWVF